MSDRPAWLAVDLVRGGTSKGVFIRRRDLPEDRDSCEPILLDLMGSPDPTQIDGLGGAVSVTSKVALIDASPLPEADVDYLFAQVDVARPIVDWHGTCGNILAAVGPYAVNHGLVSARGPHALVKIHLVNTDQFVHARVPLDRDGRARAAGGYAIDGVPGTGARIDLAFLEPGGTKDASTLLPTGHVTDTLAVPGLGAVEASIVDAGNKAVFVRAADIGADDPGFPGAPPSETTCARLEAVRAAAAVLLGLASTPQEATALTPAVPKVGAVAPRRRYQTSGGPDVEAAQVDLTCLLMSMQKPHPSCMVTGAIAIAAASAVPGSVVAGVCGSRTVTDRPETIRIGHPHGTLDARITAHSTAPDGGSGPVYVETVEVGRTARVLVEGRAFPLARQATD